MWDIINNTATDTTTSDGPLITTQQYGIWDQFGSTYEYLNQGQITGISSWGIFFNEGYAWHGALGNFAWTSISNESNSSDHRRSNVADEVIGNGRFFADDCEPFQLSQDEY